MERFQEGLRAQRLGNRREPRVEIAVPVLLNGSDVNGRPLDQRVMTINVSRHGAVLSGIYGLVRVGDEVSLARGRHKARFRVQWAVKKNPRKPARSASRQSMPRQRFGRLPGGLTRRRRSR